MENHYQNLNATDRVTLMLMIRQGANLRTVTRELKRSPSTLSRELKRHAVDCASTCPRGQICRCSVKTSWMHRLPAQYRPRKRLGFKPQLEVFMDLIKRTQETPSDVH